MILISAESSQALLLIVDSALATTLGWFLFFVFVFVLFVFMCASFHTSNIYLLYCVILFLDAYAL